MVAYLKAERLNLIHLFKSPTSGLPLLRVMHVPNVTLLCDAVGLPQIHLDGNTETSGPHLLRGRRRPWGCPVA